MAGTATKIGTNVASGFIVSFVGTLPLGYLNMLALQIYLTQSVLNTALFALGVVAVEVIAVRLTLLSAVWLLSKKRLMLYLELFTIAFMAAFALYFFLAEDSILQNNHVKVNYAIHPFVFGLMMNGLNFMQYPFWAGWNICLINNKKLIAKKPYYYWYLLSTAIGSFCGMLLFVFAATFLLQKGAGIIPVSFNTLFAVIFALLAVLQIFKLYKKQRALHTA